ncbi:uncharacterized protein [Lepeophtheirus salmonis]|uniref:uncharacterized protein n=1 Tax=Lepeophtheirus salmonis TaxID=72036 RepID=UPI003AF34CDB
MKTINNNKHLSSYNSPHLGVSGMGSLLDIRDNLVSRYSSLGSCEYIQKNDGSSFLLIRPSINELSGYLPKLYVVVELGTVKLLSYHGNVLKEEKLDGGQILDCLNEGKLFMCLGIGNQTLNDSLVKHVYSEPSKGEGEIAFRSRKCSFFLENTPGLCSECQSLLTTLYNIKDNFDNDKLDNDWTLSEFKQEEEAFNDNIITLNECSNCLKAFNNISSLNRHKLKCLNDSGDNEDKSDLIQEDEVFFEDNKIINECSKCLKTFNNTSSLNRHKRRCLKDPDFAKNKIICKSAIPSIECSICLKKLTHKGHLHHSKLHDKRMNLNEVIHCPLCGHSIDNRRLLNAHIHDSHDASKGCCGVCFEIVSNEYLSRHFEKHHNCNPKKNLCSECGKKFKLPSDLQNHIAYVHDVKGEKYVVCEQCGEVLPDLTVLKGHIRRLHKKTYTCHKCNKVFFENYRLKKHLKIHAGVKPYKCSRCNYCCVRKDNVFIHLRRVHKIIPTSNDVITIAEQIKLSESIIS